MSDNYTPNIDDNFDVAIIGMSGRFPGSENIGAFWQNLCTGVESVRFFSEEELKGVGIDSETLDDPNYVKASPVLDQVELFDAAFFGYSPRDAQNMDPQHRFFLESSWSALEHAGYNADEYEGSIGVYGGTSMSAYLYFGGGLPTIYHDQIPLLIGNDKDFLTTRVSYKLNLTGPSVTVQTACSTSLVAVHMACQSLLNSECDMALAGGVSIRVPQTMGYFYHDGGMVSPDGHCRPFDAQAQGTTFGSGVGVVVLKRLADAVADGDTIWAVVKGSAVNNDGSAKAGFTAPSVNKQSEVVTTAMAVAQVHAETMGYIEAHGTATPLGDPIEIEALTQAYRAQTQKNGYCAIGSVKSNIGHLDVAAGVTGLIKTVLALKYGKIPPSLHFQTPNPKIDFENSPFVVNDKLREWKSTSKPRRAGVSSLGVGGTNVHVVLEESPPDVPNETMKSWHILPISAKTSSALEVVTADLAEHLERSPELPTEDVAHTLQQGRKHFNHRRTLVCVDREDAIETLTTLPSERVFTSVSDRDRRETVFMFSGQGSQHVNMCLDLYDEEPVFQEQVDLCSELLSPHLDLDLRELLFPSESQAEEATAQLSQTFITQPALFTIEYSLAMTLSNLGIKPSALVGHSIGEYVAACISGVFSLEEALRLVAARGRLMQSLPAGAMLAVPLSEEEVQQYLSQEISLAVLNSASISVVSGEVDVIAALAGDLLEKDIESTILRTSHAFHSAMMDPILEDFTKTVEQTSRQTPNIPFASNVTGTWITSEQAKDPVYWANHLRHTVKFYHCAEHLLTTYPDGIFLEIGPGQVLATLLKQHPASTQNHSILASTKRPIEEKDDVQVFLNTLGKLWLNGVSVQWAQLYTEEKRKRIPLPTYPFERDRYWLESMTRPASVSRYSSDSGTPNEQFKETREPAANKPVGVNADSEKQDSRQARIQFQLLNIVARVWGCEPDKISKTMNFLEQGFDSLSLTQVSSAIRRELQTEVTFSQLMEELATVEKVSHYIDQQLPPGADEKIVDSPAGNYNIGSAATVQRENNGADSEFQLLRAEVQSLTKQVQILTSKVSPTEDNAVESSHITHDENGTVAIPLTDAQREVWFSCQLDNNATKAYNESLLINLHGDLKYEILQASIQELINRHDSLRAVFSETGEQQSINDKADPVLTVHDLAGAHEDEQKQELTARIIEQNKTFFDLKSGPLVAAQLLTLGPASHALHVTYHHLIMDGWSAHVFLIELSKLYAAKSNKKIPELAPAMQYRDYVDWYLLPDSQEDRKRAEQYWLKLFDDLPAAVELPLDRSRPPKRSYRSEQVGLSLDSDVSTGINNVCSKLNCTLFHFLFGTFNVWVHRLTDLDTIVVGVPVAGHLSATLADDPASFHLVGHCVNLLPIRSTLQSGTRFSLLIEELKQQVLEARRHENLSYGKLIERLNPPRNSNQLPLVSISFNLVNNVPELDWGGVQAEVEYPAKPFIFFDLMVNVVASSEKIQIKLDYSTDLFETETIERWLKQWQHVIEGCLNDPVAKIGELPLLGDEEKQKLLIDWNETSVDNPLDSCLHQLIQNQAERTPEAIAAQFEDQTLTYGQLEEQSNKLANHLQSLGVGPNKLVGVFLERSLEMLISLMGILKAGGAYVPLDPAYPADRISYVLEDADAVALVTQESLLASLGDISATIVNLDDARKELEKQSTELTVSGVESSNLAYVIYTSGSTGKPKGVQIQHHAIVNFLCSMKREPGLSQEDVLLAVTTLSFDIHTLEIFLPLITGASVIIAPQVTVSDGRALVAAIEHYGVTSMQATPASFRLMMAAGWSGTANLKILCGGEPLPQDLARQLLPRCAELWNMYGPTETTVWSTCARVTDASDIHIGCPIDNTDVYIVDQALQAVPIGVVGELLIGGDGLAKCYHNRPDLTAENFVDHPYRPGKKIYCTGDNARYRADGNIDCLGRIDNQVKIRGYRIELGEIESILSQHNLIESSVVVAREDEPGEKQLAAYIVSSSQGALNPEDLRQHLQQQLPDYMIPAFFVFLDTLPLTPNGKIDRKALPRPEVQNDTGGQYQTPEGETEQILAEIMASTLKVSKVGRKDNFFDLGGHSILAVKFFTAIESRFGKRLPLATLYEFPTIENLSLLLEDMSYEASWEPMVAIQSNGTKKPLFFMHSEGGNVLEYYHLSRELGLDQPFYALQAYGLDSGIAKYVRIEEMAKRYLNEIKKIQTNGPYLLGGYCLGGLIAYELAEQLVKQGEEVSLLALVSTVEPSHWKEKTGDLNLLKRSFFSAHERVGLELDNLSSLTLTEKLAYSWERINTAATMGQTQLERFAGTIFKKFDKKINSYSSAYKLRMIKEANVKAFFAYDPPESSCDATLFRASKYSGLIELGLENGWEQRVEKELRVIDIDAYHKNILKPPHVKQLAENLQSRLAEI